MAVDVAFRLNKFRVMDKELNTIATDFCGNPCDGGGYLDQNEALSLAATINSDLATGLALFLPPSELSEFKLSDIDSDGVQLYEKEVIYADEFTQEIPGLPTKQFSVPPAMIFHWHESTQRMLGNGVKIPMPVGHTENAEANRATVVGSRVGMNEKNKLALYVKCKPRDKDVEKLFKTSDVSIFVPHEKTDGKGNKYKLPITHVALTDYPTIPGMSGFKPLAASLSLLSLSNGDAINMAGPNFGGGGQGGGQSGGGANGGMGMNTGAPGVNPGTLQSIAQKLGIPNYQGMDNAAIEDAIIGVVTKLKAQYDGQGTNDANDPNNRNNTTGNGQQQNNSGNTGNFGQRKVGPALAASIGGLIRTNRRMAINSLVDNGCITKACADELIADWCGNDAIALSLSNAEDGIDTEGAFNRMVAIQQKNKAFDFQQRTGSQVMSLAQPLSGVDANDPTQNPLLKNANQRADAAKNAGLRN